MKQLFSGCEKKSYNLLYNKKDVVQVISYEVNALFPKLNQNVTWPAHLIYNLLTSFVL